MEHDWPGSTIRVSLGIKTRSMLENREEISWEETSLVFKIQIQTHRRENASIKRRMFRSSSEIERLSAFRFILFICEIELIWSSETLWRKKGVEATGSRFNFFAYDEALPNPNTWYFLFWRAYHSRAAWYCCLTFATDTTSDAIRFHCPFGETNSSLYVSQNMQQRIYTIMSLVFLILYKRT